MYNFDDCEVAVIGAGPYGLATAAHLNAAGIRTRVFGEPMSFWRDHMPKGMTLRSKMTVSSIADPESLFSLNAYVEQRNLVRNDPFPLEDFVDYGRWFQARAVPNLDARLITRIERDNVEFLLTLQDGGQVSARRVVLATGLGGHDYWPPPFANLPRALVSHTSDHPDLDIFSGRRVAVVGRGQSAIGSAALLNAAGAEVELISRGPLRWFGSASDEKPGLRSRLGQALAAPSGVGSFPFNWLVEFQGLMHLLPPNLRNWVSDRCLRPGSSAYLLPQFQGVTVRAGRETVAAHAISGKIRLQFDNGAGTYDHVLLGTGYRIDIARFGFLAPDLLRRIVQVGGAPVLANGFESSVPGLHFVGGSAVWSYGPLMRFVCGAGYAARSITQRARADRRSNAPRRDTKMALTTASPG